MKSYIDIRNETYKLLNEKEFIPFIKPSYLETIQTFSLCLSLITLSEETKKRFFQDFSKLKKINYDNNTNFYKIADEIDTVEDFYDTMVTLRVMIEMESASKTSEKDYIELCSTIFDALIEIFKYKEFENMKKYEKKVRFTICGININY